MRDPLMPHAHHPDHGLIVEDFFDDIGQHVQRDDRGQTWIDGRLQDDLDPWLTMADIYAFAVVLAVITILLVIAGRFS